MEASFFWLTFVLMMTAIAYTPGPITMFSMSSSVRNGFYRTLPAIAGGSFAYLTQMAVVYLGLGVIVLESVLVFNTIKWAGVFYLFILAVKKKRCLTHIQNKATAVILFIAGGMLACSEK
jgi:homoserine/homoserine lactone efflux protein